MSDLESLEYPRYLHGPQFAHLLVQTPDEARARIREGWSLLVVFDDEPLPVIPEPIKRGPGRPKKNP